MTKPILLLALTLAAFLAAGCGAKDGAVSQETKPSEVKLNMDQATQDKLASSLKNYKPSK